MNSHEKELLKYYRELGSADQQAVLSFAHFLFDKTPAAKPIQTTPLEITPPENETVVSAIKRLKKSYPMLDSMKVFNPASEILTQHLMQGKDRAQAISELELLFQEKYREYQADTSEQGAATDN